MLCLKPCFGAARVCTETGRLPARSHVTYAVFLFFSVFLSLPPSSSNLSGERRHPPESEKRRARRHFGFHSLQTAAASGMCILQFALFVSFALCLACQQLCLAVAVFLVLHASFCVVCRANDGSSLDVFTLFLFLFVLTPSQPREGCIRWRNVSSEVLRKRRNSLFCFKRRNSLFCFKRRNSLFCFPHHYFVVWGEDLRGNEVE